MQRTKMSSWYVDDSSKIDTMREKSNETEQTGREKIEENCSAHIEDYHVLATK